MIALAVMIPTSHTEWTNYQVICFSLLVAEGDAATPYSAGTIIIKLLSVLLLVAANGFFVAAEFALVGVRIVAHRNSRCGGQSFGKAPDGTAAKSQRLPLRLPAGNHSRFAGSGLDRRTCDRAPAGSTAVGILGLVATRHRFRHRLLDNHFVAHRARRTGAEVDGPRALRKKLRWRSRCRCNSSIAVFSLPIRALDWASVRTVQLIGIKATSEHASTYTEEELRRLVDISRESGHLRAEERRLIHRVFEFSDTLVREAMVPRTEMAAISNTCDLEEITKAFEQHRYSRLPVYRESFDDVSGFIHSKDVMPYLLHPEKFRLEDVLQPPLYVVDTARLEHVLRQMQKAKMHFGFVVDEHGGLEGIITLEDLLEEIVGEISDEHDEEVNEQITEVDQATYVLDGGLAVRDLNRRLKLSVPSRKLTRRSAAF